MSFANAHDAWLDSGNPANQPDEDERQPEDRDWDAVNDAERDADLDEREDW